MEQEGLLHDDLGPFHEETDEWRNTAIVLSKWGARIMAVSVEQSIRGLRHSSHRPDLEIFDDIEDIESVKSRESRDKTWNWVIGEAIPAGDMDTRIVMVGNHLHNDSVLQRYRKHIEVTKHGVYKAYPLLDEHGTCLWKERYTTDADIEALKRQVPDDVAFQREYMLTIVAEEDRVIRREWIQHYAPDFLPKYPYPTHMYTGVDPVITENTWSDYTAFVSAYVIGSGKDRRICILPNIVNKRMDIVQMTEALMKRSLDIGNGHKTKIFVEAVGFQHSLGQLLRNERFPAEDVPVGRMDKRERLSLVAGAIQRGEILFPPMDRNVQMLIDQLVGFGTEKHDDLVDAFSMLCLKLLDYKRGTSIGMATYDPVTRKTTVVGSSELEQDIELEYTTMEKYLRYQDARSDAMDAGTLFPDTR